MPSPQGRYWLLTVPENEFTPILPVGVTYIKGQLEVAPTTGYRHWQIVACFEKKVSLRPVRALFGEFHAELTRSSAAIAYVWKDDTAVPNTRFEFGELPFNPARKTDWARVRAAAVSGNFDSIPDNIFVQHYRTLRAIRSDYARPVAMVRQCFVFWGPTRTGKSRRAWDEAGMDAYPKAPTTKWWDGYQAHKNVVIDEFRGNNYLTLGEISITHLLRWVDRYPVLVEVKGGTVPLVAEKLWLTSNLDPRLWYPEADSDVRNAVLARLNITHFDSL